MRNRNWGKSVQSFHLIQIFQTGSFTFLLTKLFWQLNEMQNDQGGLLCRCRMDTSCMYAVFESSCSSNTYENLDDMNIRYFNGNKTKMGTVLGVLP